MNYTIILDYTQIPFILLYSSVQLLSQNLEKIKNVDTRLETNNCYLLPLHSHNCERGQDSIYSHVQSL